MHSYIHISKLFYLISIIIFELITMSSLVNLLSVSMHSPIFKLSIVEPCITCLNSSSETMWLILFIDHAWVIVFEIKSLYFNIGKCFKRCLACIKWWFLKSFIPKVNIYFSIFFKYFWWFIWNAWILIKYALDFLLIYLFLR